MIHDTSSPDSKVHGANMGSTSSCRSEAGSMLALWTLLSVRPLTHWGRARWSPFRRRYCQMLFNENIPISINFSLKFVPKGPINNIPASVQIMAWRRPCDKPLSEPMMVSLLTHICVTRPQWGNKNPRTQKGILDGGSYSWNQLSRYYDAYPIYSNMYSIVLTENTMLEQNMFTSTQKWGWLRLATNLRLMNIYNQSCWQFMPKVIHYLCVLVWYVLAGFAFVHCIRNSKGSEDYGRNTYLERQNIIDR